MLEEVARAKGVEPAAIEVWFADEARIGQKNKITRRWALRGTRPAAPHDQRTASTYIFGAVCPKQGKGAALVLPHWVLLQRLASAASRLRDGSGQLTSRSNLEQLGNEGSLSPDVASAKIPNLPLPDHRYRLIARQRSSRRPEATEAEPWADHTSYAPVVLFHDVIEELALS